MTQLLAASLLTISAACAEITGGGSISSTAVDTLGETMGGIGSAIEPLRDGRVVMMSDRGPGDGTVDYRPRLQFFSVQRHDKRMDFSLDRTVLLSDADGKSYTGLFPKSGSGNLPAHADGRQCLDPEGLAVAADGRFFVAEEYGPSVLEFSPEGKLLRRFETPAECVPQGENGVDLGEADGDKLKSGREPNRGFEGITLMPGEKALAVILQSGLLQDGGREAGAVRMYIFDVATGRATAAFAVPFANVASLNATSPAGKEIKPKHLAFSSLSALPDGRLLALERENFGEDGSNNYDVARYKALVILDPQGADNILGRDLAAAKVRVKRTPLVNLASMDSTTLGEASEKLPAKWEGIGLLKVAGDRVRFLLSSDNDFLNPVLTLERSGLQTVSFPKCERAQPTQIFELALSLPPRAGNSTPSEPSS